MKKVFVFILSLVFLCFLVFFFVQFRKKPSEKEAGIWRLEKIDNFKILSIKQNGSPFSDAQSALFLKKIRYESLPLSAVFFFTTTSSLRNPKEIECRIVYKNIEIEKTIRDLDNFSEDSSYKSSGLFSFNLSDLKKTSAEHEILEFMKAFPLDPQIQYSIKPLYDSDNSGKQDWIHLY
jgi:hypothetical protein